MLYYARGLSVRYIATFYDLAASTVHEKLEIYRKSLAPEKRANAEANRKKVLMQIRMGLRKPYMIHQGTPTRNYKTRTMKVKYGKKRFG